MSNSQNGWPVVTSASIASFPVTGSTVRLPVLPGDVATVLTYVAERFNKEVEPLHPGWCWGYAKRNVIGSSTTISNHASGTAIDLNAPDHPLGVHGTFSATQVAAIDAILAFCDGAVRWGGHYTKRKDEMHFEIDLDAEKIAAVAIKIRQSREAVKPTVSIAHTLVPGTSHHRETMVVQRVLHITPDGFFGPKTAAAVKHFKGKSKVTAVHVDRNNPRVGPATAKAMGIRWTG